MSLETDDRFVDAAMEPGSTAPVAVPRAGSVISLEKDHISGGGYSTKGGPSAAGIATTIAIHAALLGGLLQLGSSYVAQNAERLVAIDLRSPPPPAPTEAPPPQPRQEIVAVESPIRLAPPAPIKIVIDSPPVPAPAISAPPFPQSKPAAPTPVAARPVPDIVNASDLGTRMISGQPPRYPIESRRKREQGTVMLAVTLGTDGRVADISVMESSGFPRLDQAALKAVKRWRWEPTLRGGMPVMVRGIVPIPFILQGTA